jgi:small-conductance mechanosensitive channel
MNRQLNQWLDKWNLPPLAWNLTLLLLALLAAFIIRGMLALLIRKNTAQPRYSLLRSVGTHLGKPVSFFLPLFLLNLFVPLMELPAGIIARLLKAVEISLIITFAWLLIRSISVVQDFVMYRYDYAKEDNLRERKIRTQLLYLRQVITGFIILLAFAAILLSFDTMRRLGAGLLAGVGIGGIVVGFAAQRSLANLLAGFQIAFTQPIRIDDVVVVEGEWGRVEEITLTYVVVHIWDERRLVLPITYFIEKPFQNWTRTSSNIIGTVMIYADYTLPIEPLRKELDRLLEGQPLWDGRVKNLALTDASEQTVQIRALVSAANSGNAFDLRCFIRENLVAFINREYPQCLPRTRTEWNTSSAELALPEKKPV